MDDVPFHTVVDMPHKGYGVVAARDIPANTTLFHEEPLLRLTPDGHGRYDGRYGCGGDRDRCRALLHTLSQHACGKGNAGAGALERVIETNGFVIEGGAATVVFLHISRCNHDCTSNARFEWDPASSTGAVITKQCISNGTEVTLNYGATGSRAERQRYLLQRFGFGVHDAADHLASSAAPGPLALASSRNHASSTTYPKS